MAIENPRGTIVPGAISAVAPVVKAIDAHAGLTDIGRVRATNQDRWFADPDRQIYIVSDGMGGQQAGELASRAVVELLPAELARAIGQHANLDDPEVRTKAVAAVRELSRNIYRESHGQPGISGMGATLVTVVVRGNRALVLHLGDSRVYQFRDRRLHRLTRDHTLVQQLLDARVISPDEAVHHAARGQLSLFIGMPGEATPEASIIEFSPGDRLLLCTDGLTGMLDDGKIESIIAQAQDPATACRRLVDAANQAGGKDNVTVLTIFRPASC